VIGDHLRREVVVELVARGIRKRRLRQRVVLQRAARPGDHLPIHVLALGVGQQRAVCRAPIALDRRGKRPHVRAHAARLTQFRHRDLVLSELAQSRHQLLIGSDRTLLRCDGQRQQRDLSHHRHHETIQLGHRHPPASAGRPSDIPPLPGYRKNLRTNPDVVKRVTIAIRLGRSAGATFF
jgi:hypothetical protein